MKTKKVKIKVLSEQEKHYMAETVILKLMKKKVINEFSKKEDCDREFIKLINEVEDKVSTIIFNNL